MEKAISLAQHSILVLVNNGKSSASVQLLLTCINEDKPDTIPPQVCDQVIIPPQFGNQLLIPPQNSSQTYIPPKLVVNTYSTTAFPYAQLICLDAKRNKMLAFTRRV